MDIGKIIRLHRKKAKLSQLELAQLAGVGKTVVYDIEHGRMSIRFSTLLSLCDILNIHVTFTSPYMRECEEKNES